VTERAVALLVHDGPSPAAPPGRPGRELRRALAEDTYEVLASLELVSAALALCPPGQPDIAELGWPGTPVLPVPAGPSGAEEVTVLEGLGGLGAGAGAVVAEDVPDLPPLLIGKLFRALGSAQVAACPAAGGGLVALASRLPVPGWLVDAGVGLDTPEAQHRLAAAAPSRRQFAVAPGWRRLRRPSDLAGLDQGLEGWEATRALLASW
jgi:hypothetical protein